MPPTQSPTRAYEAQNEKEALRHGKESTTLGTDEASRF